MQKSGVIVRFDAARGFGFIRCPDSIADVFFHVRDFRGAGAAPVEGLAVVYEEIHVGGKGPRGMAVRTQYSEPERAAVVQRPRRAAERRPAEAAAWEGKVWMLPLMLAYAALLGWAFVQRRLPLPALQFLAVVNPVCFVVYAFDKSAARRGGWRTSENRLHLLSLLGGWPAAWIAQQWLRHKSSKDSFLDSYRVTVLGHWMALAAWLWFTLPATG
jgi:uncharacterized membrane protein YsdA (DUF1294 family)/cold shock CspA family protein